ncbi:MAG: tRNA preQ1(34) S-adenosylmethionine ribosyltransferase-isomerase QueA [Brevinema sp.]
MSHLSYFLDFFLPPELIATHPSPTRDHDRMMIYNNKKMYHKSFKNISDYLSAGDLIIFNNSKVFKARLDIVSQKSEVNSELLLLDQENSNTWTAMIKKARRFKKGDFFSLLDGTKVKVEDILEDGIRRIVFERAFFAEDADKIGQVPLPPYIIDERKKRGEILYTSEDEERYQTIFAKYYGSVAAPTASLRFSEEVILNLKQKGVLFDEVTLHVGMGTFKPMDKDPNEFQMHREKFFISHNTIKHILEVKKNKGRIIAAGTTVCRVLESINWKDLPNHDIDGSTNIFIKPGYEFQAIDALITNFHLPHSTLLLLVQAFIGIEPTKKLYEEALAQKYRFFSYGDGMLLFPKPFLNL